MQSLRVQKIGAFLKSLDVKIRNDAAADDHPDSAVYGTTREAFAHLLEIAAGRNLAPYTTGAGRKLLAQDKLNFARGELKMRRMVTRLTACPEFEPVFRMEGFWVHVSPETVKLPS